MINITEYSIYKGHLTITFNTNENIIINCQGGPYIAYDENGKTYIFEIIGKNIIVKPTVRISTITTFKAEFIGHIPPLNEKLEEKEFYIITDKDKISRAHSESGYL